MIEDYESINEMTDAQAAEVLENMRIRIDGGRGNGKTKLFYSYNVAMQKAIQKLKAGWIPVTYRPMTEEEAKKFCEELGIKEGSLEDWEKRVFTCRLPDDGQEILTSFGKYVREDICSWDEYGCGLENNGDWDGIDAWMPKPEPYKKEGNK